MCGIAYRYKFPCLSIDSAACASSLLPPVLSVPDMDLVYDVNENGIQLLTSNSNDYTLCNIKDRDIHIMNKQAITRHIDKFMELV